MTLCLKSIYFLYKTFIVFKDVIFYEDHVGFSPTIMVKAIATTIETHMNFPTPKDLTPMKSNVPNKILTPPTEVEAFKDLTLLKQGHSHDFEIGIDPISIPIYSVHNLKVMI